MIPCASNRQRSRPSAIPLQLDHYSCLDDSTFPRERTTDYVDQLFAAKHENVRRCPAFTKLVYMKTPFPQSLVESLRPADVRRLPVSMRLAATIIAVSLVALPMQAAAAGQLWAGAAKIDITTRGVPLANEPWYVTALVIGNESTRAVIVSVDAVAVAEIGSIRNDYVSNVRTQLQKDLKVVPTNILFNATHRHGAVCADIEQRTIQAVKEAWANMVPVAIGAGTGHENRIMENRRVRLKNGREADIRHAYALPADEEVAGIGPVDPEIGIVRLDRMNGQPLAVLYNFALHPNLSAPHGANSADINGFASKVIEENLGNGAIALFIQGCAGDIGPVLYKEYSDVRDPEPLGNRLGLSTLRAVKQIETRENGALNVINETIALPRANNVRQIEELQAEQIRLMQSLKGTPLNLKTFIPMIVKYNYSSEFPSSYSHRYLHEKMIGRSDLVTLDADNRKRMQDYIANIAVMEELVRLQANLTLLKTNQAHNQAAGKPIEVEVMGIRIGDFRLVTFPGELTVQIGLNLKKASPHELTFVAGYSNGYIHYAATAEQLRNVGHALEDSNCLMAPEWQAIYESKALEVLKRL